MFDISSGKPAGGGTSAAPLQVKGIFLDFTAFRYIMDRALTSC
jgi:hypothetical protein